MSFSENFISLSDLFVAYRKAKREAFDDTNCAHGVKFANYERQLEQNLRELRRRLFHRQRDWFNNLKFLGRVACIGKQITPSSANQESHFAISDPLQHWDRIHKEKKSKAKAEFRPVIDASVEFQIISALWIIKVGDIFDATLDSRYAVGNRLKRWRSPADAEPGSVGPLNLRSRYLFVPYYGAYGAWRARGLAAMKQELKLGNRIVAVTMDLKKFYHRVDVRFILNAEYLKYCGITLTRDQKELTKQLISAVETWNKAAHQEFDDGIVGLPVGLTASSLLANVLLREFDATIVEELAPAYYGRYVDDVFLVLRDGRKFGSGKEVMRWLCERLGAITSYDEEDENEPKLRLSFPYSERSDLYFAEGKQKVFQLTGQSGLDLIDPIEEQIRRQRSEHRDLPNVPDRAAEMAARALLVTSDATLDADALRHADVVTLRRAGFALLLGAIERHAESVEGKEWDKLRAKFYGLSQRHLLTPHGFFAYHRYLPRIISLMVAKSDIMAATEFIEHLGRLIDVLEKTCTFVSGQLDLACRVLADRLVEAILQSWPTQNRTATFQLFSLLGKIVSRDADYPSSRRAAQVRADRLFRADWGRDRYSIKWIDSHQDDRASVSPPVNRAVRDVLNLEAVESFRAAARLPEPYWPALAFATRPISIAEITGYAPRLLSDYESLRSIVFGLRGAWMPPRTALKVRPPNDGRPMRITLPFSREEPVRVAVANFETTDEEWRAAVVGKPLLSLSRYRRLNRLINQIIDQPRRPNYLVLPECALPRKWARFVAMKLAMNGVSFVAGLEYRKVGTRLRNEALVSLISDFAGYNTNVCVFQPKFAPAWGEKTLLAQIAGTELHPPQSGDLALPVYIHGGFCFSVLICSDLTTLAHRNMLQGKVDCLFVPEWNQDIETFSSLVEASAQDLHAFMVQANNRQFGDSRIRAPYRQNYMRDVVRVRGGLHDYFVIGEIDFRSLRRFQRNANPPLGPSELFKPFPIGFKMSAFREAHS